MKNLFFLFLFVAFGFQLQAQQVVRLDELRMTLTLDDLKVDPNSNSLRLFIPEEYTGEFAENPLMFVKQKFNISEFIEANEDSEFDNYRVSFRSSKGRLNAVYDKDGNLTSSSQIFKNVYMPYRTTVDLLKQNQDWVIASNKHVAISREWNIEKDYYKVKLRKGKARKTVRLDMIPQRSQGVASN